MLVFAPLLMVILLSPAGEEIWEDAQAWERPLGPRKVSVADGKLMWLAYLFAKCREFRSLAYYRLGRHGLVWQAVAQVLRLIYRPQMSLYLDCPDIGPRLFIEHGFGTSVAAEKIGADCWINQHVTIGYGSEPGLPILGDGVYVRTGAVVVGRVKLGDRARVSANSLVIRDIDADTMALGVPARSFAVN